MPEIVIAQSDERRLTTLATAATLTDQSHQAARILLAEMERAQVVPDHAVPKTVVRMHSLVNYQIEGREHRSVQIVYPGEANIDLDRISILTPVGAALIGLSAGQAMRLIGHDGRPYTITVTQVSQPEIAEPTAERIR
jgi:regulator of nucleoside diphosphate kinase